jgi:6-phosphogluconolactonase
MAAEQLLLIGSYTRPEAHVPSACGEGVVTCALDLETGRLERRTVFRDILNPSYLALDAENRRVFAVSENTTDEGEVCQFQPGSGGGLSEVARPRSHGAATCHVAVLPGERLCAASYFGGLAVYPLREGRLAPASRVFRYEGQGANPQRQEASHPHQTVVAPGARWFYVCDLGADCLWQHDIAAEGQPVKIAMPPGHGPRHLVFHPTLRRLYVLGELTGAVAVCDWDAGPGTVKVVGATPALSADAAAAAIRVHPSGRALWTSIRSVRSLLTFPLDEQGAPGKAEEISLGTGEPRDFAVSPDGRWLVTAGQSANELAVLELDPHTGMATSRPVGRFPMATPVCVLFLPNSI